MEIINVLIKSIDNLLNQKPSKIFINTQIKDYGKLIDLKINNKDKSISFVLLLKGEDSPIKGQANYAIVKKKNDTFLRIISFDSDKKWIKAIFKHFIIGKEFHIKNKYVNFLEDFLN